jgi:uncharacterized protein
MTIDWINFTPTSALLGGALIGLSAALFVLLSGRIAGISGIVGGLLQRGKPGDAGWRFAFVAGLLLAPTLYQLVATMPESRIDADIATLIIAGLLVGFGSRLGNGCTSGHGVCGLSRLSLRSLGATLTFMATGFITVYVLRHLLA